MKWFWWSSGFNHNCRLYYKQFHRINRRSVTCGCEAEYKTLITMKSWTILLMKQPQTSFNCGDTCIVSAAVRWWSQLHHTGSCERQTTDAFCRNFVLFAVFHDEPMFGNIKKRLKHWEGICLLYVMQKEGKLHSAAKLCGHVSAGIWLTQILLWIGF